jgi:isopentenyl phosphate kinase
MDTTTRPHETNRLVFLKLGGSLITDKLTPRTPRMSVLDRLAGEIQAGLVENPGLQILVGHGSGSFGHTSGNLYHTREGVSTPEEWLGFSEVWADAANLNRLVMTALRDAGLPAVGFPPSASILTRDRKIISWELSQIRSALENNLLPVVFGDVVYDESLGGTILSTEDLFVHLAAALRPQHVLLAGLDPGVWQDYPACTRLLEEITPADKNDMDGKINHSEATDVTGGMGDKVNQMLDLISTMPNLEAHIFSGAIAGNVQRALGGDSPGTRLHS